MLRLISLLFLTVLPCMSLFSQFRPGYIINNRGDTIRGSVNFEGSIVNSARCEFRTADENPSTVYKPGEIKAFRFDNGKYFSSFDTGKDGTREIIFAEWLIRGKASLVSCSGLGSDLRYFLLSADGTVTELINSTYRFVQNGVEYERKKREYAATLTYQLRDCPEVLKKIEYLPFNGKAMLNLLKSYNEQSGGDKGYTVFEANYRKLSIGWGVSAAFLNSALKLNNDLPENVYPLNTFGAGLAVSINNLPGLPPRFSVKITPQIFSTLVRFDTTGAWSLIEDDRICRITYARIPVQFEYKFTQGKFNPFIAAGGTINLRFAYKQFDQNLTDWITRSNIWSGYDSGVNPLQFGVNAGAGFEYLLKGNKKLDIGYTFELCRRFYGTYIDDRSVNRNNYIFIRYFFK